MNNRLTSVLRLIFVTSFDPANQRSMVGDTAWARENETCRLRYAHRATKNAVVGCQNVIDFRSFLFIEERWTARGAVPTTRKNAAEVIATSALGAHRFHIQVPNHQ